jgi:hypothetical protein
MLVPKPIIWQEGKTFAFSIFDDTDEAQVATVKPIYDFLIVLISVPHCEESSSVASGLETTPG